MARSSAERTWIIVKRLDAPDSDPIKLVGRDAWALECLFAAGPGGCTPLTHVGPRWSHYVWKIRRTGIAVETITEFPRRRVLWPPRPLYLEDSRPCSGAQRRR